MTFTLQRWDFDLDSATLGSIRCTHFDASKKFREFEESIRASTVDSAALARNIFQTVARKRTGDTAIDAKCGGDRFGDEEVSTLTLDELDQFCDKLLKGRLRLVATAVDAPPQPARPVFATGREGLAPALMHFAEANQASMKRTLEAAERGSRAVFDVEQAFGGKAAMRAMQEAQRHENMMKAAFGTLDIASVFSNKALEDVRRRDEMLKATAGISGQMESFLKQTSLGSAAADAFAQENLKKSLGLTSDMEAFLRNQTSVHAAIESMAGVSSLEAAARGLTDRVRIATPDIAGLAESAPTLPHVPLYIPPPNPIHKTNDKLDELLEHRRAEATKKDVDRSGATAESGENKKIATTGLTYTKISTWFAIVATFLAIWIYVEGKMDAAEASKKENQSQIQLEELRTEIRLLKAHKPTADKTAAAPNGQVAGKQKPAVVPARDKVDAGGTVRPASAQ